MAAPCKPPLGTIPGTGFNIVSVPDQAGSSYNNAADQLLYEIWQTLLLILAAQNPPGMAIPILFTIGDGKVGTPIAGTTSLSLAALANKAFIVLRNGIQLTFSDGTTELYIIRKNTGAVAGFDFDPAPFGNVANTLTFQNGDSYQIFITGLDNVIE